MKSNLVAIIKRLEAMVESDDTEIQTRRFEQNGVVKAEVSFNSEDQIFSLTEVTSGFTSSFDDIDIVAMEIYDLIF